MSRNQKLNTAIENRFNKIRHRLIMRQCNSDFGYVYYGQRCKSCNLGPRFKQHYYLKQGLQAIPSYWLLFKVWVGLEDKMIEYIWHDAAGAEYWYKYEKEWS